MTPRQKRMATVVAIIAGVGIATAFALQAFNKNLLYYYSPTQISAGEAPSSIDMAPGRLPRVVRALVEAGWHIEAQGKLDDLLATSEEMQRLWRGEIED